MMSIIVPIIAVLLILLLVYKLLTKNHDRFDKLGLKYIKPVILFGSNGFILRQRQGLYEQLLERYQKFPDQKLIGYFNFTTPTFLLRDTNLIKQINIKDFQHFQDRTPFFDPDIDDFFGNIIFAMRGQKWRDMRSTLSPLFTSSKMRMLFQFIMECTKQFVDYVDEEHRNSKTTSFSVKEVFSKYANDVIGSCAYGVECDSLKNPKNEFYAIGNDFPKLDSKFQLIKFMLLGFCPKFAAFLGLRVFTDNMKKEFYNLVLHAMNMRKEQGIIRPDLINLLMCLREGKAQSLYEPGNKELEEVKNLLNGEIKRKWSDNELIAQCFGFFLAGFDTVSNLLQFIAFELAANQDVQEKLFQEVLETNENLKGKPLSYDAIRDMKYMNMVVNESLRKWPPSLETDRVCTRDYSYEDNDGYKFNIKKGEVINIPIYPLHMDPQYFPNPDNFDPERFSEENKGNINMDAFLPFGIGPRGCIGIRFALMETKVLFYHLVLNFKFQLGENIKVPLELQPALFHLVPAQEIYVDFKPRNIKKDN